MDKCCIVLNPAARTARKLGVASLLPKAAPHAVLRLTEGPGHAEILAREAVGLGFKTVVAGGGDGTVSEVLRGIAGADVRLGVLPLGTMNVFVRELRLPLDWRAAWETVTRGEERRVDVGWANGRPFAQLAGVGFDAAALARVRPAWKRRLGSLAYVCAGVEALFAPMPRLRVSAEGQPPLEGVWVVVGTGRYYGGPFPVFPRAQNGGGLLNVLIVRDLGFGCLLGGLCTLPMGWHMNLPQVSCFQTRSLRVEPAAVAGEMPGLEVDGELWGDAPVDFRIEHAALRVAALPPARRDANIEGVLRL